MLAQPRDKEPTLFNTSVGLSIYRAVAKGVVVVSELFAGACTRITSLQLGL